MSEENYKDWHVVQSVELGASAAEVWEVIGGFYTIHDWCPDISECVPIEGQNSVRELRRLLTFPGQPKAIEELVSMDNANFHYRYKWHQGEWGAAVHKYHSSLRVIDTVGGRCTVQWVADFYYFEDAISDFYLNSLGELQRRFPLT